jgi:hypothetical protein
MNAMTRMSAAFICSILVFIVCIILCSGPVQDAPSSGAETPYVSDVTAAGKQQTLHSLKNMKRLPGI